MADGRTLFILAGEPSGDRIGAALVEQLRARVPLTLQGVGGTALEGQGLRSLFPMSDLSVMGYSEVIRRLPKLLWRVEQAAAAIRRLNPDAVVLIDSQVFSAQVAKRVRARGYRGQIVLYVAPAVWAWKPERAPGLKALFDQVLAVLPFEPKVMAELGGPTTHYVGHPAAAQIPFRAAVPERGPLLLLPGSRDAEIRHTLPLMQAVAEQLSGHPKLTGFVLPTPASQRHRIDAAVAGWRVPVRVVSSEADKLAAFGAAIAALAVSGTVTLELAMAGVPTVATYVADKGQTRRFIKYGVKFVTLPNIILGRQVLPELLFTVAPEQGFSAPDALRLAAAVTELLETEGALDRQAAAFAEIRALMEKGAPEAPLVDAADLVAGVLGADQRRSMPT